MPIITLPLPPIELKVNRIAGEHWGEYQKAKREYRLKCDSVLRSYEWGPDDGAYPVHVTATVFLRKRQKADTPDVGSWVKVAIDRMVACGVFRNDSNKYINPFTARVDRDWDNPRLEIAW